MATSKCAKCGGTSFELAQVTPTRSNYALLFVQCASCGAVVGVLDGLNIGHSLEKVADVINAIAGHFGIAKRAQL